MKLVPLYNKIIVELIKEETDKVTSSGLIIPGNPNPYYRGTVISVGKGHYQNAKRIAMDVEEGQIIIFLKNSGFGVKFDYAGNATHLILADTDIYAVESAE